MQDRNKKTLVENDKVLVCKTYSTDSNANQRFLSKYLMYGVVGSEKQRKDTWCNSDQLVVNYHHLSKNLNLGFERQFLYEEHLIKIEPEEFKHYEEVLASQTKFLLERIEKVKNFNLVPSKVNYQNRTFNLDDKMIFNTNVNTVRIGRWDNNLFHSKELKFKANCCAFTKKTTDDLEVYIPNIWLHYFEWTVFDLVEWLKFISNCEIGFKYQYLGLETVPGYLKEEQPVFSAFDNYSIIYPKKDELFHVVRIKGSQYSLHTYLHYICLRYIFNHQYWTIPGHAMQIKKALGEEVTYWEALLMAHLANDYENYYSFVKNLTFDKERPYEATKTEEGEIKLLPSTFDTMNYDRHVDPFQSKEKVLKNLETSDRLMNASFAYLCDTYTRQELDEFFKNKNYIGLYDYLKSKKENVTSKQWQIPN